MLLCQPQGLRLVAQWLSAAGARPPSCQREVRVVRRLMVQEARSPAREAVGCRLVLGCGFMGELLFWLLDGAMVGRLEVFMELVRSS